MSVMVLGASGMLGHMLTTHLQDSGHEVIAVSRHGEFGAIPVAVDLRDSKALVDQLEHFRPTWVINAAGLLNDEVDRMKSSAILVNSFLPQFLSDIGPDFGFRMVTVGSDCVFEGDRGRYLVTDIPDARSAYGRTKQLGEVVNDRDLTIRTSIVGPEVDPDGRGLLLWLTSQTREAEGWTAAVWTGVTTLELARLIEAQVSGRIEETGLWQFVPESPITKFDLLNLMNMALLRGRLTISPVPGIAHDRSLVNDRLASQKVPSYSEMLLELRDWIEAHQELYWNTPFLSSETGSSTVQDSSHAITAPNETDR